MKDSTYHRLLRISALTFAILLLFDSGLLSPVTRTLSQNTQLYMAQSIGMYASVQPTELNELTAQLSQRDRDLTQRENALSQREIAVSLENTSEANQYSTYILSVILFLILVLLILNYTLDFLRLKRYEVPKIHNEKMA